MGSPNLVMANHSLPLLLGGRMSNNLTQPEEIDMVIREFSDYFTKSENENTQTSKLKSKSSCRTNDDEYYIPLYKTSFFN
jgi:hypothetical protein